CGLLIEPEGVLFLGDIDLSSFGPYYGDAWSDLEDFERSLRRVAAVEAKVWVSFHHVGVIEQAETFHARLARFSGKLVERERALVDFLRVPRTMAAMVAHRFLYPSHATMPFIDGVEQRTIEQHLRRFLEQGIVERCDESSYRALAA